MLRSLDDAETADSVPDQLDLGKVADDGNEQRAAETGQ